MAFDKIKWHSILRMSRHACFPWLIIIFMIVQQTNTAEMLDLAVQYIKSLQSQLQVYMPLEFLHDSDNVVTSLPSDLLDLNLFPRSCNKSEQTAHVRVGMQLVFRKLFLRVQSLVIKDLLFVCKYFREAILFMFLQK